MGTRASASARMAHTRTPLRAYSVCTGRSILFPRPYTSSFSSASSSSFSAFVCTAVYIRSFPSSLLRASLQSPSARDAPEWVLLFFLCFFTGALVFLYDLQELIARIIEHFFLSVYQANVLALVPIVRKM